MRQFRQQRRDRRGLRPLDQGAGVGFERRRRIGLLKSAIERVRPGAVAAQHRLPHAVGVDQHSRLGIALPRARRDRFAHRFKRKRRGNAMRGEDLGERRLRRSHAATESDETNECEF